jgi:hypothetical protein
MIKVFKENVASVEELKDALSDLIVAANMVEGASLPQFELDTKVRAVYQLNRAKKIINRIIRDLE